MSSFSPHSYHEVPSSRSLGILHDILNKVHAEMSCRLIAKSRRIPGKRQVIVDGFWHMCHPNPSPHFLLNDVGGICSIVSTYRNEIVNLERF